jgi:hypothetical protein
MNHPANLNRGGDFCYQIDSEVLSHSPKGFAGQENGSSKRKGAGALTCRFVFIKQGLLIGGPNGRNQTGRTNTIQDSQLAHTASTGIFVSRWLFVFSGPKAELRPFHAATELH